MQYVYSTQFDIKLINEAIPINLLQKPLKLSMPIVLNGPKCDKPTGVDKSVFQRQSTLFQS